MIEKIIILSSVQMSMVHCKGFDRFRAKNSDSLARAMSLAIMRALAFDIDKGYSTTFLEKIYNYRKVN